MKLERTSKRKVSAIIRFIIGFLLFLFLLAFSRELLWLLGLPPDTESILNRSVLNPFHFLYYDFVFGYGLTFFCWVVLLSFQAILPVTNLVEDFSQGFLEVHRTVWHFFLYILGFHGLAITVKDGQANTTSEDLSRGELPGVVVVDYNSAVVLEERNPPPGCARILIDLFMLLLRWMGLMDGYQSPRVLRAGVTFIRPRERIRGVVDLRKQFRMEMRVPCYTREGIELQANVFALFTIGQDPEVLQVAFEGPRRPENLRIITFERPNREESLKKWHGEPDTRLRVTSISNDLDDADRAEIFHYARVARHTRSMQPYTELPNSTLQQFNRDRVFSAVSGKAQDTRQINRDQVFSAVSGQAQDPEQQTLEWDRLPTRVAAEIYRDILSHVNFDGLYNIPGEGPLPMMGYRATMRQRMRFNGILAFRLIETLDGKPFEVDQHYFPSEIFASDVRELTNPKVLRERGIKVLFSSFGDPIPVNDAVYRQRLDSWRATWDRELDITHASRELQAMRVRTRAYVDAQKDIWYSLTQLFEQEQVSDEALALRLLQALEQAAADPRTRALLPANTIDLLRDMRMLLVPGEFLFPTR